MGVRIYNTMTKKKEEFVPRESGKVAMYVCGPTTYNLIHLGNARPLIVFDMVRRYLEYKGFNVTFIQNFTDIDDKIINRAKEENMDAIKLAAKYIEEFYKDADALGVRKADYHPKVSEHLPEVIEMIQTLIQKGYAYEIEGDVYFAVNQFAAYGKLSGRSLEDMQAGARVEVDQRKRHPMDFALWKSAKPGEPSWPSPWGPGRPGWHIECSAMSLKYLGHGFDIHGGGYDLIFPHHENEIAQSEAYCGKPFANYWMHNGFITINEEKMSKSLGNFFTLREILGKYEPEVVRFYMLSTHYRSPLDFDDSKLEVSKKSLSRLRNSVLSIEEALSRQLPNEGEVDEEVVGKVKNNRKHFEEAMDDDFNTALAIAYLFDLAKEANIYIQTHQSDWQQIHANTLQVIGSTLKLLAKALGLLEKIPQAEGENPELVDSLMNLILELRQDSRAKKDWATADKIRDVLAANGIEIKDTPQGAKWQIKQ